MPSNWEESEAVEPADDTMKTREDSVANDSFAPPATVGRVSTTGHQARIPTSLWHYQTAGPTVFMPRPSWYPTTSMTYNPTAGLSVPAPRAPYYPAMGMAYNPRARVPGSMPRGPYHPAMSMTYNPTGPSASVPIAPYYPARIMTYNPMPGPESSGVSGHDGQQWPADTSSIADGASEANPPGGKNPTGGRSRGRSLRKESTT